MDIIRTFKPFFMPYKWHMLMVIASSIVVTLTNLIMPWVIRDLVAIIAESGGVIPVDVIRNLALILTASMLLRSAGHYAKDYIAHVLAWNIVSDVQGALYRHIQSLSMRFYANRHSGELMSRITSDTRELEAIMAHTIPDTIVNGSLIIGICTVLLLINSTLTLLVLLPMPFLIYAVKRFAQHEMDGFTMALNTQSELFAKVGDNLAGIREIQIFTQERTQGDAVSKLAKKTTDERLMALRNQARIPASVELAAGIGMVLIVLIGGQMAITGTLAVEDLVAFVLYLGILYQPIRILAYMNEGLQMAIVGGSRVHELFQIAPEIDDPDDGIKPETIDGKITFENINFGYLDEHPVLENINVTVNPGQTLALVGPTGAGKSTLTNLVARFYDPEGGRILIDGIDVREMKLSALRENISMVLQDVFLFNGTIMDNIRFSKPSATDKEIYQATKIAAAHDFIMELPDGYQTRIGERGIKLSGGQKQRIAIARAVLKDAPLLILDEATSSVDTQTEADIQEALERLMQGRTSIVIAHRLSTVHNADLIAVLQDGHIIERGKHKDLLEQSGLYRQLYEQQFRLAG